MSDILIFLLLKFLKNFLSIYLWSLPLEKALTLNLYRNLNHYLQFSPQMIINVTYIYEAYRKLLNNLLKKVLKSTAFLEISPRHQPIQSAPDRQSVCDGPYWVSKSMCWCLTFDMNRHIPTLYWCRSKKLEPVWVSRYRYRVKIVIMASFRPIFLSTTGETLLVEIDSYIVHPF
jgi:hypothetical protein